MKILVAVVLPFLAFVVTKAEPPSPYTTTYEDVFVPPPPPSFDSSSPSASYGAPSSGFNALSTSYVTPSSSFGLSSSSFGNPSTSYGAPSGSLFSGSLGNQYQPQRKAIGQTTAAIFSPSSRYGTPSSAYGAPSGFGNQDDHSEPANYEFSYTVEDAPSGNDFGHREGRQGDSSWGSYFVLLPDGRKQIVEYTADQNGYKPTIRYVDTGRGYGQGSGGYSY